MGEKIKIILLFLGSIIVYGIIASLFTSTVHIDVDEELYTALARSFHYSGKFEYGNQLLNYNCVLYSMLISLAYFFYSPTTILFSMRMIGVIALCSSVFPIYLLAKSVLEDGKKALFLSAFLLIMPYMFDGAYIMQEVLSYPLFMWMLYFLYQSYGKEDRRKMAFLVLGSIFSVLCVFTKTYLFFVPITLNICALYYVLKGKNVKGYIIKTLLYDVIYVMLFAGMYFMIFAINGFERGSNHYSSQFSQLFPIGVNTVIFGLQGCVLYFVFLIINMGLLPISAVFYKWKREKEKSWIINFVMVSILFLIVEIVFMIVLTEEGTGTLPHKFLFRYFQIFVPPIIILFTKYAEEKRLINSRKFLLIMEMNLFIALIYFILMKGQTKQAIIDGHLFLFVENITKFIFPYADAIIIALGMILLIIVFGLCMKKIENIQLILRLCIAGVFLFWIIDAVQLPYYNNVIAGGRTIQSDSIKIAEYLNEKDYEYVYYVYESTEEKNSYLRNFYGYIIQPYQIIAKEDAVNLINDNNDYKTAFLFPPDASLLSDRQEIQMVDLNNEKLCLYILQ